MLKEYNKINNNNGRLYQVGLNYYTDIYSNDEYSLIMEHVAKILVPDSIIA